MNPEDRDEDLLREYLEGDSALSRLYRSDAAEQPGAQLDARIRALARRAEVRTSRVAHSPFARHWAVPASLAAVLVLSVSVVLLTPGPGLEPGFEPGLEDGGVAETPAAAVGASDTPAATAPGEEMPAPASEPAPAEPATRRERAAAREDSASRGRASDSVPLQPPGVKQDVNEPVGKSGEKREGKTARSKRVTSDEDQLRPATPARAGAAEEAATSSVSRALSEPLSAPHPMPDDSVQADPTAWLRFIEVLLNEQKLEAATSNLRVFRTRYPDFSLPPSLAPLAAALDAERP